MGALAVGHRVVVRTDNQYDGVVTARGNGHARAMAGHYGVVTRILVMPAFLVDLLLPDPPFDAEVRFIGHVGGSMDPTIAMNPDGWWFYARELEHAD